MIYSVDKTGLKPRTQRLRWQGGVWGVPGYTGVFVAKTKWPKHQKITVK